MEKRQSKKSPGIAFFSAPQYQKFLIIRYDQKNRKLGPISDFFDEHRNPIFSLEFLKLIWWQFGIAQRRRLELEKNNRHWEFLESESDYVSHLSWRSESRTTVSAFQIMSLPNLWKVSRRTAYPNPPKWRVFQPRVFYSSIYREDFWPISNWSKRFARSGCHPCTSLWYFCKVRICYTERKKYEGGRNWEMKALEMTKKHIIMII